MLMHWLYLNISLASFLDPIPINIKNRKYLSFELLYSVENVVTWGFLLRRIEAEVLGKLVNIGIVGVCGS